MRTLKVHLVWFINRIFSVGLFPVKNLKEKKIKKGILTSLAAISMSIAFLAGMPSFTLSSSLNTISDYSIEDMSQSGPEAYIDTIANWFGVDLIGPQGLGVKFGVSGNMIASGGASSFQNVTWQFWNYGSTQSAYTQYFWSTIHRLDGYIGESADITIDYRYENNHLNTCFDGRSQSKSSAGFSYAIIPSDVAGEYDQNAKQAILNTLFYNPFCSYNEPTIFDYIHQNFTYDKSYYFGALTWGDDTETGSFSVGNMETGDVLYLLGGLRVESQAQVYGPGVVISTMVSTLETNLKITETTPSPRPSPIPEPGTILLLGSGLVGLAGIGRRFNSCRYMKMEKPRQSRGIAIHPKWCSA